MVISERLNIYEYEQLLLGQRTGFSCSFKGTKKQNEIEFGNIWRYVVTKILKWTPEEAVQFLTKSIIQQLMLDHTYFAINLQKSDFIYDTRRMLQYAFPEQLRYDLRQETIDVYDKIFRKKELTDSEFAGKYPKSFFIDRDGEKRANILLMYMVNKYLGDMTLEEQYEFFASEKSKKWLEDKKLYHQVIGIIYSNPLEYFDESININDRDPLYYWTEAIMAATK